MNLRIIFQYFQALKSQESLLLGCDKRKHLPEFKVSQWRGVGVNPQSYFTGIYSILFQEKKTNNKKIRTNYNEQGELLMRHFELIRDGIDVQPFVDELAANSELFGTDSSRQEGIPVQRETQAVLLFGVDVGDVDRSELNYAFHDTQARIGMPIRYRGRATPESKILPLSQQFVRDLCCEMKGVPGRAVIARLNPDGRIYKHIDDQLYWLLRDRYHLVVTCGEKGSWFRANDEEVYMRKGELWWFDPTVYHEAHNGSDEQRIHFVIDVLSPHSMKSYMVRAMRAPVRTTFRSIKSMLKRYRPPSTATMPPGAQS